MKYKWYIFIIFFMAINLILMYRYYQQSPNAKVYKEHRYNGSTSLHSHDATNATNGDKPSGQVLNLFSPVHYKTNGHTSTHGGRNLTILAWSLDHVVNLKLNLSGHSYRTEDGHICEITTNKSLYNTSDAVVIKLSFHGGGVHPLPSHRFYFQKWVAFEFEAPSRCDIRWPKGSKMDAVKHMFNVSSTFTPDSTVPLQKPYTRSRYLEIHNRTLDVLTKKNINYSSHSSKDAVWFVSHCKV